MNGLTWYPVITLAGVIDRDHNCIRASCLAHRRAVFTGGDQPGFVHLDLHPCGGEQ